MISQNIVHQINLGFSNVWLYGTPGNWLLIDAGMKMSTPRLYRRLGELDIEPEDIKLIVATHVHFDHVGGIGKLKKDAPQIQVAVHELEAAILAQGKYVLSDGFILKARAAVCFMRTFINKSLVAFDPVKPSFVISGERRLDDFGFDVTLIPTPGHTDGSLAALSDSGYIFSGDLIINRPYKGIWKHMSRYGTSSELIKQQWQILLDRGAETVCPGHGDMFPIKELQAFL